MTEVEAYRRDQVAGKLERLAAQVLWQADPWIARVELAPPYVARLEATAKELRAIARQLRYTAKRGRRDVLVRRQTELQRRS